MCLQTFQSDMICRQQILHSILREGQQMLADGDVENKEQFEKKLKLLQEQWDQVVTRSQQKKGEIRQTCCTMVNLQEPKGQTAGR